MDKVAIVFRALELLPMFMPRPKPPVIDYQQLRSALPNIPVKMTEVTVEAPAAVKPAQKTNEVATSCMACSRSHLSTVSGALNEALRFARDEGIQSREVQKRIMMAEDELTINERIDLSAEAIQNSPEPEQRLAREYLPRIRSLRQELGQIRSVEELEKVAAKASILSQEFRLAQLQMRGVDLNPIVDLAKRVKAGEITMEQAKEQLHSILPEE